MWQWSKQGEDAVIPFVLFNQAWTWYEKSVSRWMQIPNSSKISGNGQAAATTDQKELGLRFGKSLQHFQPWPVTWSEPLVYENLAVAARCRSSVRSLLTWPSSACTSS